MIVIISILSVMLSTTLIYMGINKINKEKMKHKLVNNWGYNKLTEYIQLSNEKNMFSRHLGNITPMWLLILMFSLFIISFLIFYSYIKVFSTAIILSLPIFISPILIIKILINKEKSDILKILPLYVVSIKSHISEENNIISAIQRTNVEQPLKKYMDRFKVNINRGMNVIEALDIIKKDVNIKLFTDFVNACQGCYLNGGDFNKVLERYINILTKENTHKESAKEKAYADILTLIILIVLNVLVIVMFVFTNKEYAVIMRETFFGRAILNFNAISYILIAYLISRIYKEE